MTEGHKLLEGTGAGCNVPAPIIHMEL